MMALLVWEPPLFSFTGGHRGEEMLADVPATRAEGEGALTGSSVRGKCTR